LSRNSQYTPVSKSSSEGSSGSSGGKLELLQVFRGLAALIVVVHHICGSNFFYLDYIMLGGTMKAGWNGVDFFFVLSGFIITYIHYKDLGHREKIRSYLTKRVIRIYPSYWIFTAIAIVMLLLAHSLDTKSTSFFLKSLFLIPQQEVPIVGVAWSLYYEIIFYAVFAIYLLLGKRFFFGGIVLHLSLIVYAHFHPDCFQDIRLLNVLSNNFNVEFLIGCLVGVVFLHIPFTVLASYRLVLLIVGALLFAFTWHLSLVDPHFNKSSMYCRLFYGLASAMLILSSGSFAGISQSKIGQLFLKIGDASYVLYLSHGLIVAGAYKFFSSLVRKGTVPQTDGLLYLYAVSILFLCTLFAIYFYDYVEKKVIGYLSSTLLPTHKRG
jgi:peptidoglycan/LPS O-acetylase OafA/YrhL